MHFEKDTTLDTTPPVTIITSPAAGTRENADFNVTYSDTDNIGF